MQILNICLFMAGVDIIAGKDGVHISINTGQSCEDGQNGVVAFHALMTKSINPEKQQTLVFDVVKTNKGNGYNNVNGEFVAPKSGFYVFIYVIRMWSAEHSTELMINNTVYGATFLRAKNGDDSHVSGTVVTYVNEGDKVFVRNHSIYKGDGLVNTNEHGQSTFSGWLLK